MKIIVSFTLFLTSIYLEKVLFMMFYLQTKYGDIYDCVDFYKQPAFHHQLLKNHNFHPKACFYSFILLSIFFDNN